MAEHPNDQTDETQTISNAKVGDVNATSVTIRQASVDQITTERASINQSSVKQLDARSAQFEQSSVFRMKAENVVLTQSAASFVDADEARLVKCNALVVRGDTNAVEGDLKTVIHIGAASGNVHTIFDRDGALRFGLGLGASLVALGALVRKVVR
jgi:hypothetical protein